MGRGRSKVGTGGVKGTLTVGGDAIEFDGTLKYGPKDKALAPQERKTVEAWEKKREKQKIEYAYAVYENGTEVGPEVRGGEKSVISPRSYHMAQNGTFTHIHPRENGKLGGTFSPSDLFNFAFGLSQTARAVAKEGTYSISKAKGFQEGPFHHYVMKFNSEREKEYHDTVDKSYAKWADGKISLEQTQRDQRRAFNTYLVNMHNDLLAGQKKYNYTYTLEKRR